MKNLIEFPFYILYFVCCFIGERKQQKEGVSYLRNLLASQI